MGSSSAKKLISTFSEKANLLLFVIFTAQQGRWTVLICILHKLYASGLVFKGHINPCKDPAVLLLEMPTAKQCCDLQRTALYGSFKSQL